MKARFCSFIRVAQAGQLVLTFLKSDKTHNFKDLKVFFFSPCGVPTASPPISVILSFLFVIPLISLPLFCSQLNAGFGLDLPEKCRPPGVQERTRACGGSWVSSPSRSSVQYNTSKVHCTLEVLCCTKENKT